MGYKAVDNEYHHSHLFIVINPFAFFQTYFWENSARIDSDTFPCPLAEKKISDRMYSNPYLIVPWDQSQQTQDPDIQWSREARTGHFQLCKAARAKQSRTWQRIPVYTCYNARQSGRILVNWRDHAPPINVIERLYPLHSFSYVSHLPCGSKTQTWGEFHGSSCIGPAARLDDVIDGRLVIETDFEKIFKIFIYWHKVGDILELGAYGQKQSLVRIKSERPMHRLGIGKSIVD
jgi:hypothetical protein